MKIKQSIACLTALLGLAFLGLNSASAQTSDNATLNVVLSASQSISVNAAQKTVELDFSTPSDYQNGVTSTQSDHLSVSSTSGFIVNVKSDGDLTDGTNSIPIGDINVTASAGSAGTTGSESFGSALALTTADQALITSGSGSTGGVLDGKYNVEYNATGGADFIAVPAATYTATLTYSIVAN